VEITSLLATGVVAGREHTKQNKGHNRKEGEKQSAERGWEVVWLAKCKPCLITFLTVNFYNFLQAFCSAELDIHEHGILSHF